MTMAIEDCTALKIKGAKTSMPNSKNILRYDQLIRDANMKIAKDAIMTVTI